MSSRTLTASRHRIEVQPCPGYHKQGGTNATDGLQKGRPAFSRRPSGYEEALQQLKASVFEDLVISDIKMTDGSGIDLFSGK